MFLLSFKMILLIMITDKRIDKSFKDLYYNMDIVREAGYGYIKGTDD